jgi:sugar phosphate isomerase/epimerase
MKKLFYLLPVLALTIFGCGNKGSDSAIIQDGDSSTNWRLGVALWTFHTSDFPDALELVDSSDLRYIEPNTFHHSGPALKDSLVHQLSPSGINALKNMVDRKGFKVESFYVVGDSTIESWKKQFEIAKKFGAKFITTEPPLNLWDEIDSLAGIYGMKVAIHEHWKGVSDYWHPDTVLLAIKNHPNFGACADLGHWPKSGIDPVDAVKKLSGHIIAIHLKDIAAYNNPELKDVPVGTGVVNFPAVFEELKRQGFNGPIYIERDEEDKPNNLPSVLRTIEYYNEQVRRLQ